MEPGVMEPGVMADEAVKQPHGDEFSFEVTSEKRKNYLSVWCGTSIWSQEQPGVCLLCGQAKRLFLSCRTLLSLTTRDHCPLLAQVF